MQFQSCCQVCKSSKYIFVLFGGSRGCKRVVYVILCLWISISPILETKKSENHKSALYITPVEFSKKNKKIERKKVVAYFYNGKSNNISKKNHKLTW